MSVPPPTASTVAAAPGSRVASAKAPRLDRSRHAAPQVLDDLRERIIGLDLPPGMVLSRAELAARFGLSQTPVRDALMRLQEEGLVEVFAQHKTVVSRIDIHAAQQAHFLRCAVEVEIVRALAQQPDPALVKELRAIIARQKIARDAGDYPAFVADDQTFHRTMYQAARVPDLYTIVRQHSGHIDRLRRLHVPEPGKASAIVDDHKRIVDSIARGQPDEAVRRLREHLSGTLSWVDKVRTKYPDYVAN
ncbi:MAG TPA: GntR family transcriptional regulator [Casimicrobiaceae bacterium]|nr:GntR family transcriptional regulator [Casimicrobiaceae bacterium]